MKALLISTALAVLLACQASAQDSKCGTHGRAIERLSEGYGESVVARALDAKGRMLEILTNPETGRWTALLTTPPDLSCIVAGGTDYEAISPIPSGEEM